MNKKNFYAEDQNKTLNQKVTAIKRQKYFTAGSILLMFVVLLLMYVVLN